MKQINIIIRFIKEQNMKIARRFKLVFLLLTIIASCFQLKASGTIPENRSNNLKIEGVVWHDLNGDGIRETSEPFMSEFNMTLKGTTSGGQEIEITAYTGLNGYYAFTNLEPGNYMVIIENPFNDGSFTIRDQDEADFLDSDIDPQTGESEIIVLTENQDIVTIDAGYYHFVNIGDFVWEDKNGNGLQEIGENGIQNIKIRLTRQDEYRIIDVYSDAKGKYLFGHEFEIRPGEFSLTFYPNNTYSLIDNNMGNDTLDSDPDIITKSTQNFSLLSGEKTFVWDAGFYKPIILGDYCWNDKNANGIQEIGEPPLNDVIARIYRANDNFLVDSFTTNETGKYIFKKVKPGSYYLKFTLPQIYKFTLPNSALENVDSDSDTVKGVTETISAFSGDIIDWIDIGAYYYRPDEFRDKYADECIEAEIQCDLTNNDNISFQMKPEWQQVPLSGCFEYSVFQNPIWFSFVPSSSYVEFILHTYSCNKEIGLNGLQWGVYDDCNMQNPVYLQCECKEPGKYEIALVDLIAGHPYYFFIDGCGGTFCDVLIELSKGFGSTEVTDPIGFHVYCNNSTCEYIFGNQEVIIRLDQNKKATNYRWQINSNQVIETNEPFLKYIFTEAGVQDISVLCSNYCDTANVFSFTLMVFDSTAIHNCEAIQPYDTISIASNDDFEYTCINEKFDLSASLYDLNYLDLNFAKTPVIWYKIDSDNFRNTLFSAIESKSGKWQPVWAIFYCENNKLINASENTCALQSNLDNNPDFYAIISQNTHKTYYLGLTYDPLYPPNPDDLDFEICLSSADSLQYVGGHLDPLCTDRSKIEFKITEREHPELEPALDSLVGFMGPFLEGEKIKIEVNMNYSTEDKGSDWLIGMIPDFIHGFDMDSYDFNKFIPIVTNSDNYTPKAEYHIQDSDCAPLIAENSEYYCTMIDSKGKLNLINKLVEKAVCDKTYMNALDPLPGGYFWISNGSNSGCKNESCKPNERWGIGRNQSDFSWKFDIKIDSIELNHIDLNNYIQLTIQTLNDGIGGCWEDPLGEHYDLKHFSPRWKVIKRPDTSITIDNKKPELCSGVDTTQISLSAFSTDSLKVTFEDNIFIEGENNYTFQGNSGLINDILMIIDESVCEPQNVRYFIKAFHKGSVIYDTTTVVVNPVPKFNKALIPDYICIGDLPVEIELSVNCSTFSNNFAWHDQTDQISGTNNIIQFGKSAKTGSHKIKVDMQGKCSSSEEFDIEIGKTYSFELNNITTCWDEEKIIDPKFLDDLSNADLKYKWYWEDENFPGSTNQNFKITKDDYESFLTPGIHNLCLEVTESATDVCKYDACISVTVREKIDTSVTLVDNKLIAKEVNAYYQWFDCDNNFEELSGENSQTFIPAKSGNYAVEITKDECIDTSFCHSVIIDGIIENTFNENVIVYPNPTSGIVNIKFVNKHKNLSLIVYNSTGEIINHIYKSVNTDNLTFNLDSPPGIYLLKVMSNDKYALIKLVNE